MEAGTLRQKAMIIRLYPTAEQATLIHKTIGCARFVYNHFLAKKKEVYQTTGKTLSHKETDQQLTQLKRTELTSWLAEVDKFALQQSLRDLEKAYQNFFRTVKTKGKRVGFPKFKKKRTGGRYRTQFTNGNIEFRDGKLKLPKLGWLKTKRRDQIPSRIINVTVRQHHKGYYEASILTEVKIPYLPPAPKYAVGVDVGIKDFAVMTDGRGFNREHNPKFYRRAMRQLRKAQQTLARRKKGSVRHGKAKTKLTRVHSKIARQRQDFLHKLTTTLVLQYEVICTEHLKPQNILRNRRLSLCISDTGWGEFIRQLNYKTQWYGRQLSRVDPHYPSSQLCSCCNTKNPAVKDLSIRTWTCAECGAKHDRDENAATNIRREGLRKTGLNEQMLAAGMAERINAHGVPVRLTSVSTEL